MHRMIIRQAFLSIDCGLPKGSDYKDVTTGIDYKSDANLIDSGESISLLPSITSNTIAKYFTNVRSFPKGKKNCYTIQPSPGKGNKFLIRASFMYGNYDSLNQFPIFDLNLGSDTWSKVEIQANLSVVRKEIIHILSSDYLHICLIKTGTTTPFISALELRPFSSTGSMYTTTSGSLQSLYHVDCDTTSPTTIIRYKDDSYDRRWFPFNWTSTGVSTVLDINNLNDYRVPVDVLRTASGPDNVSEPFLFSWITGDASDEFYMYVHFAEVEKLEANQSREFNIYINGAKWNQELVVPKYLEVTTYFDERPKTGNTQYTVSLNRTENSTHPPIINAYEIYSVKKISTSGTKETDVSAILNLKSKYGVTKDSWQGDPCEPEEFLWEGLKCSKHSTDSARITTLDLSMSGLTGEIDTSIADLTKLDTLDLSNNNLSGQVPGFLSRLASLRVLNLKGNNFSGPIPAQLLENAKKGVLSLSFDGTGNDTTSKDTNTSGNDTDTKLCGTEPCKDKSNKSIPVIVGSVIGAILVLAAILFGIWILRKRILRDRKTGNQTQVNIGDIEKKNRQFTYSEVLTITGNFRKVLGKGGFGTVYHGYVGDTEVAVKMLSPSSTQGYKEFQTEANLLLSVHHKNLTSLVGYCNEDTNMGIIYEYMANRSLDKHLLGKNDGALSWKTRLQIAVDAAQGLEYLHHGCKPAIIHRDVKTSNILLNEQFQAKLADFGLSRAYSDEGGTHVSTIVAGTPGYLDPHYYTSSRLTEKSDVFSFGVVLLEMITGQPAILRNEDRTHITEWVDSTVKNGDIKQVIDPSFRGNYDVNAVWKAVELALACASQISSNRPTMNTVVMELKECLAIEINSHDTDPVNSIGMVSMDLENSMAPRPR
ncbi:putative BRASSINOSTEROID INSENSITIVE 1-associated receptor kinase 1 [Heracleum sosnowskyi]|uniref:non-specific serine/threonine protein kinase n=1 Tax=Heracleum sosnowskyi TaxID=360622 RepID=A0AAD8H5W7_9APIA|nr:putative BRASSINOSTEROID INSENSITIVE 1-associated receptor kinase 1 [Heracleum sosnowskyi]